MSIISNMRAARVAGGKPVFQQLLEAVTLRFSEQAVGMSEYVEYGMADPAITRAKLDEFIGWKRSGELDRLLNNFQSRVLANDKLINHAILLAARLPSPTPLATYTAGGRRLGYEQLLTTTEEVRKFLRREVYPFYVKPISAGYGRGVMGVAEREGEHLNLMDGTKIDIDSFLKPFEFAPYRGMLFQKPLVVHPAIAELTGTSAISCVRFICFVTSKGPEIHTAFWKITAGKNMLDNFSHGDYGNCLGAVDKTNGKIVRAISKMGPAGQIERHPSTGRLMIGFQLPHWEDAVALVKSASAHFPGLRLQNWDVALCPEGAVLLELNTESELAVPQAISGVGFMDSHLRDILQQIESDNLTHRAAVRSTN